MVVIKVCISVSCASKASHEDGDVAEESEEEAKEVHKEVLAILAEVLDDDEEERAPLAEEDALCGANEERDGENAEGEEISGNL